MQVVAVSSMQPMLVSAKIFLREDD